ncbi:MAG: hypothetical protein SFW67_35170 [Myxococcaceae bacterium]|nr:hypothetical protein [Myxococcaceae bacterium]
MTPLSVHGPFALQAVVERSPFVARLKSAHAPAAVGGTAPLLARSNSENVQKYEPGNSA